MVPSDSTFAQAVRSSSHAKQLTRLTRDTQPNNVVYFIPLEACSTFRCAIAACQQQYAHGASSSGAHHHAHVVSGGRSARTLGSRRMRQLQCRSLGMGS